MATATESVLEVTETDGKPKPNGSYESKFLKTLEDLKPKKIAIGTHPYPDPDAIGASMGMKWLFDKMGIESDIFYSGSVSHPQNRSMVNLLDPNMISVDSCQHPAEYDYWILVDTIPSNAGIPAGTIVRWNVVIDHHKEAPNGGFDGQYINLKAGSACATVFDLIDKLGYVFDDTNDYDCNVATALMIGIMTDTENLMSDDSSEYEFKAWSKLFSCRDPNKLKQIVHFERPKFWTETKAGAVSKAVVEDGVGVVGLGRISPSHRDLIADMANDMVGWEDVNTAVVFAIVDGTRIEGCVRTKTSSLSVPSLCSELGAERQGRGGGKLGKGAYRYELGGASIDEDEDEETKNLCWDLFNQKEVKRVFRIIRNF